MGEVYKIKGTLMSVDRKNANGRIYFRDSMLNIFNDYKNRNNGRILGELGHPDSQFSINIENISHIVEDVSIHADNKIYGNITILDTPRGKILKNLIDVQGLDAFGISTRGAGTIQEDGTVTDYQLLGIDIVPKNETGWQESKLEKLDTDIPIIKTNIKEKCKAIITKIKSIISMIFQKMT